MKSVSAKPAKKYSDGPSGTSAFTSPMIEYGLQPFMIVAVLAVWLLNRDMPAIYPLTIVGVQVVLGFLEHWLPARDDWVQHAREKILNVLMVLVLASGTSAVALLYVDLLAGPLSALRQSLNLDVWPHGWPILVQVLMVFFAGEFIWYWVHRAEHRWNLVWRLSGHGAHHSFKHLGAINFGLNHPLEMFLLVLPSALVELFFGVGIAAAGATVLAVSQASIAHANLTLNSRWIGWLFTTNRYHIRHHSTVLEESNTNYGCSAIIWDRVFGTFADSTILEAGIGPTEPTLWQKLLMPVREPVDSQISPS